MPHSLIKIVLLLMLPFAIEAGGAERLDRFLAGLDTFSARFEQRVLDGDKVEIERSQGTMTLRRHQAGQGQFRWVYTDPYPQVIVSDGEVLWLYDEDLEQVTVRTIDDSMRKSPAMVLTSKGRAEDNFDVVELGQRKGDPLQWLELKPKTTSDDDEQEYAFIWLGFSGDQLSAMELIDGFGQTTHMRFSDAQRNPVVEAETFVFNIPEGVDVVTQQEQPGS